MPEPAPDAPPAPTHQWIETHYDDMAEPEGGWEAFLSSPEIIERHEATKRFKSNFGSPLAIAVWSMRRIGVPVPPELDAQIGPAPEPKRDRLKVKATAPAKARATTTGEGARALPSQALNTEDLIHSLPGNADPLALEAAVSRSLDLVERDPTRKAAVNFHRKHLRLVVERVIPAQKMLDWIEESRKVKKAGASKANPGSKNNPGAIFNANVTDFVRAKGREGR